MGQLATAPSANASQGPKKRTMTRRCRVLLATGLLALVVNFAWIPWRPIDRFNGSGVRLRSGFVWNGPRTYPTDGSFYQRVASTARPNIQVLILRSLAIVGFSVVVLLLIPGRIAKPNDD